MEYFLCDILAKMSKVEQIYFSLVIPVFNEAKNLPELYRELDASCTKLKKSLEIIFVDDGSWDESFIILKRIPKKRLQSKNLKVKKELWPDCCPLSRFRLCKRRDNHHFRC